MVKFAILIASLHERKHLLDRLLKVLYKQINDLGRGNEIQVIVNLDNRGKTTGRKRNELLEEARIRGAQYIAFFDDDDLPGPTYMKRNMEGIEGGFDCCSLLGQIYFSDKPGKPFHHSIQYDHWYEDSRTYFRNPNHLNCIKLSCLESISFKDQIFGEDAHYSIDIQNAGVLKSQYNTEDVIYHYFTGKKALKMETEIFNKLMRS